jgi:hypothetical protein
MVCGDMPRLQAGWWLLSSAVEFEALCLGPALPLHKMTVLVLGHACMAIDSQVARSCPWSAVASLLHTVPGGACCLLLLPTLRLETFEHNLTGLCWHVALMFVMQRPVCWAWARVFVLRLRLWTRYLTA